MALAPLRHKSATVSPECNTIVNLKYFLTLSTLKGTHYCNSPMKSLKDYLEETIMVN
jgi:hypothetical protein